MVRSLRALERLEVVRLLLVGMYIQRQVDMDLASDGGNIPRSIWVEVLVVVCGYIASLWPVP